MVLADVDISNSVQRGVNEVFAFIPEFIAAIVIMIVGYFLAKVIGNIVSRVLTRAGLDRTLHGGQGGDWVRRVTSSPSNLVGKLAFWAIFLGAISLAISVLGINALTEFVAAVYGYLPHVVAAVLIFLVAGALAAGVATLVGKTMGDTPTGKFVATAAPILIMSIATFMILTELGIAEQIVMITYAALIGAIALGMALAFGLGGRDVAARMLEGAYQAGRQSKEQVKQDVQQGKERAADEAQQMKGKAEGGNGAQTDPVTGVTERTRPGAGPITRR
jgi:small-conductance mechanosensitive channel